MFYSNQEILEILEKIKWLNANYGDHWLYSTETKMIEDYTTELAFLPEDVQ